MERKPSTYQAFAIAALCGAAATFGAFVGSHPQTLAAVTGNQSLYNLRFSGRFAPAVKAANPNLIKDSSSLSQYKRLMLASQSMLNDVKIDTSNGVLAIKRNGVNIRSMNCAMIAVEPQQRAGAFNIKGSGCNGFRSVNLGNTIEAFHFMGTVGDMLPYPQVATLRVTTEKDTTVNNNIITDKQDLALQAGYNVASKQVEYSALSKRRSEFKPVGLTFGETVQYSQNDPVTIQTMSYIKPGVKSPNNRLPHPDASESMHVFPGGKDGKTIISVDVNVNGDSNEITQFFADPSTVAYTMSSNVEGLIARVTFKDSKSGATMTYQLFDDATGTFDLKRI